MTAVTIDAVTDLVTATNEDACIASGTTDADSNTVTVTAWDQTGTSTTPAAATVTAVTAAWTITLDLSSLDDGPISYQATADDGAGNLATAARTATKRADTTAFVSVDEYAARTQTTITPGSDLETAVALALESACQEIRNYTGQTIDLVTGDTEALDGTGRRRMLLPQLPVLAVNTVTIDLGLDTEEILTDYVSAYGGQLWRSLGFPVGVSNVTVDYDHGYDPIPADLAGIAVSVARSAVNATPLGIISESIDGYSYQLGQNVQQAITEYAPALAPYRLPRIPAA